MIQNPRCCRSRLDQRPEDDSWRMVVFNPRKATHRVWSGKTPRNYHESDRRLRLRLSQSILSSSNDSITVTNTLHPPAFRTNVPRAKPTGNEDTRRYLGPFPTTTRDGHCSPSGDTESCDSKRKSTRAPREHPGAGNDGAPWVNEFSQSHDIQTSTWVRLSRKLEMG